VISSISKLALNIHRLTEVIKEACQRKIHLTFMHAASVFMRLESMHSFLGLVLASKARLFAFWDEFLDLAVMICDFRVEKEEIDCEQGKLQSLLFDDQGSESHASYKVAYLKKDKRRHTVEGDIFVMEGGRVLSANLKDVLAYLDRERSSNNSSTQAVPAMPPRFHETTVDGSSEFKREFPDYTSHHKAVPTFSGDTGDRDDDGKAYPSWPIFWNSFYGMFHTFMYKCLLPEFRLNALHASTSGQARNIVASYLNSPKPNAYQMCLGCLFQTYRNSDQSTTHVLAALSKARPTSHSEQHIQEYLVQVTTFITKLLNKGESVHQAYIAAADALFSSLPATVRGAFNGYFRYTGKQFTDLV
jgi:hypothetical protein